MLKLNCVELSVSHNAVEHPIDDATASSDDREKFGVKPA